MSWQNALILTKNEKVVQFWKCDYKAQMTRIKQTLLGKRAKTIEKKKNGILVLTNRKLVWIEEMGIFEKSYHHLVTIPLENIRGISMGGAMSKYVSIADMVREYVFHLTDPSMVNQDDLNFFKRIIFDRVNARKQELEAEKGT